MTTVWDTTVASRLRGDAGLEQHALARASTGDPIALTAPTVMEALRGLHARASDDDDGRTARTIRWFAGLLSSELLEVLPLDRHAAEVAGRLRAVQPLPPTGARRSASKPEQRAAWVLDIQIAACTWTHGRGIVTDNVRDFERLRDLIGQIYPGTRPLAVSAAPA